jgi:hypothetical protein
MPPKVQPEPPETVHPSACTREGPGFAIFYGTAYCTLTTPEGKQILRIRRGDAESTTDLGYEDIVASTADFASYMCSVERWLTTTAEQQEYDSGNDRRSAIREQKARKAAI